MADLYKEYLCIDLAFSLTLEMAGRYKKDVASTAFRKRILEMDLLSKVGNDVNEMLKGKKNARSVSK
jgi:CRISPR-associated protein Cas1